MRVSTFVQVLLLILFGVLALLLLSATASDAAMVIRQAKRPLMAVGSETLSGTVNQAALDTAMGKCRTANGCTLHLAPGTVVTGTLTVDGRLPDGFAVSGPIRGTRPKFEQPAIGEWAATFGSDPDDCESLVSAGNFFCQNEDYVPMICITTSSNSCGTAGAGNDPTTWSDCDPGFGVRESSCGGSVGDAPDGVLLTYFEMDGKKDEQPAPRPEHCIEDEDNSTGTCNWNKQHLIRVESGDNHILDDVRLVDSTHAAIRVIWSNNVMIRNSFADGNGCHSNPVGDDFKGDCGPDWVEVPPVFQARLGNAEGRRSNGFGFISGGLMNAMLVEDSTSGYATKMAIEFTGAGASRPCAVGGEAFPGESRLSNRNGVVQRNVANAQVALNGVCFATVDDNTVSDVWIGGEEDFAVAQGISVVASEGASSISRNTMSTIQAEGLYLSFDSRSAGTVMDENLVMDVCQGKPSLFCPSIYAKAATGSTGVDFYRNRVVVDSGFEDAAIHVDAITAGAGSAWRVALNQVEGGAGSGLASAMRIENHTGIDVRMNALEWDTPVSSAAIDLVGTNMANVTIQADAFNETLSAGNPGANTGYSGAGGVNRFSASGLTEGTHYDDCGGHLATHDQDASCYTTYTFVSFPDLQSSFNKDTAWTPALKDGIRAQDILRSALDEQVQCVIDMRDAFQLEKVVGCANDGGGANWYNVKFVTVVGDIVEGGFQFLAMDLKSQLFKHFTDPTYSVIDITWNAVLGNHDQEGLDGMGLILTPNYNTYFGGSAQQSSRAEMRISSDGDVTGDWYSSSDGLIVAHRFKPFAQWIQSLGLPFNVSTRHPNDWTAEAYTYLDEYPFDMVTYSEHSLAAGRNDTGVCDFLGFSHTRDFLTGCQKEDQSCGPGDEDAETYTNTGIGLRAFYMTNSGHTIPSRWHCVLKAVNYNNDDFLWGGENYQWATRYQIFSYIKNNGQTAYAQSDGMFVLKKHDVDAGTIDVSAYSSFACASPPCTNVNPGGYAHNLYPANPSAPLTPWPALSVTGFELLARP